MSHHLRPSLLMIALMVFQQLSGILKFSDIFVLMISYIILQSVCHFCAGINAVIFYTGKIFESANSGMSEKLQTNIVGIVQFIATCCSIPLVDRAGRKILLLISSAFMGVSLVVLGIFFQLDDNGKSEGLGWLPLVCLMIFITAFSIGYGPIPWLM